MHIKHEHHTYNDYLKTQNVWNHACKNARQRMLEKIKENKNLHYPRAFGFLPQHVRNALIEEYMYSKALDEKAPKKERTAASYARV